LRWFEFTGAIVDDREGWHVEMVVAERFFGSVVSLGIEYLSITGMEFVFHIGHPHQMVTLHKLRIHWVPILLH
jgi:hypothetical protein